MANNANITIENVHVLGGQFRNFSGKETKFTREGDHFFNIRLDEELAQMLLAEGYAVKTKDPLDAGDPPLRLLKVKLYPTNNIRAMLISSKGQTPLQFADLSLLDYADLALVDIIIRPFDWDSPALGKGRTAVLESIYATINENELDLKYASMPDSAPF